MGELDLEVLAKTVENCNGQFQVNNREDNYCSLIPVLCGSKICPYQNLRTMDVPQEHNGCPYKIRQFRCDL